MNENILVEVLDDGWTAGYEQACAILDDYNDFQKESYETVEWRLAFLLGLLDTFVAHRDALETYLAEDGLESLERIGL